MYLLRNILLAVGIAAGVLEASATEITATPSIKVKVYENPNNLIDGNPATQYAVGNLKEFKMSIKFDKPVKARWLSIIQGGWKSSPVWAAAETLKATINGKTSMTIRLAQRPAELQTIDLKAMMKVNTLQLAVTSCYPRKDAYGGFAEIKLSAQKPEHSLFPSQKTTITKFFPDLDNSPDFKCRLMELKIVFKTPCNNSLLLELPCLDGSIWQKEINPNGRTECFISLKPDDFKCIKQPKNPLPLKFHSLKSIDLNSNKPIRTKIKSISVDWPDRDKAVYPWETDPEPIDIGGTAWRPGIFRNNSGHFGWRYEPNGLLINNISFDTLEHDYSVPQFNLAYRFVIPGGNYSNKKVVFRKDNEKQTGNMINRSGIDNQKEYVTTEETYKNDEIQADWTSFKWTKKIKTKSGKTYSQQLRYSILAPGIQVETNSPSFKISAINRKKTYGPGAILYPVGNTIKIVSANSSSNLQGMSACWIIFVNGRNPEYPLMIAFQRKPNRIKLENNRLLITTSGGIGTMAMGMPFGTSRCSANLLQNWTSNPNSLPMKKFNKFVNLLTAYPWKCREYFRVNSGKVEILDKFEYLPWHDAWNSKPQKYAPLPPITALAVSKKLLPKNTVSETEDFDLPTKWGPYTARPGNTLKYHLPVPAAFDYMPLKVANTPDNQLIYERLSKSITSDKIIKAFRAVKTDSVKEPTHHPHYYAFDSSSSAFRAMNYMTHQAAEKLRNITKKMLVPALLPQSYRLRIDPLSGAKYLACTAWPAPKYKVNGDNVADIDYWQGLAIYGLYSQAKYAGRWNYLKKYWNRIRGLMSYWEAANSWAMGSPGARESGEMYHADMATAGYAGLVGFYYLSKRLGTDHQRDLAAYLLAKAAVPMVVKFTFNSWLKKIGHRDNRPSALCSGFGECWVASMNECNNKYARFEPGDPWWRTGCIGPLGAQAETMDLLVSNDFKGMLKWEQIFQRMCPDSGFIKQETMRVMPHIMLRTWLSPQMYEDAGSLLKKYHDEYLLRDVNVASGYLGWKCPVRVQDWYPAVPLSGSWNGGRAELKFNIPSGGAEISTLIKGNNATIKSNGKNIPFRIVMKRNGWTLIAFRLESGNSVGCSILLN